MLPTPVQTVVDALPYSEARLRRAVHKELLSANLKPGLSRIGEQYMVAGLPGLQRPFLADVVVRCRLVHSIDYDPDRKTGRSTCMSLAWLVKEGIAPKVNKDKFDTAMALVEKGRAPDATEEEKKKAALAWYDIPICSFFWCFVYI